MAFKLPPKSSTSLSVRALMCLCVIALATAQEVVDSNLREDEEEPEEEEDDDVKRTLRIWKLVLLPVVFVMTLAASYIPWKLTKMANAIEYMAFAACLSSGIILGAGFSHLMPDAVEAFDEYYALEGKEKSYPYDSVLAMGTFLLLVAIDVSLTRAHTHGHSHAIPDISKHEHPDPQKSSLVADKKQSAEYHSIVNASDDGAHHVVHIHSSKELSDPASERGISEVDDTAEAAAAKERVIQAWIFVGAISLHSIFDGLSLGGETEMNGFYALLAAIVGHKALDGLALGIPVYYAKMSKWTTFAVLAFAAAMTPLGIGVGMVATEFLSGAKGKLAEAIISSLSYGSFMYIAIWELLPAGFGVEGRTWLKIVCVTVGWGLMAMIAIWA